MMKLLHRFFLILAIYGTSAALAQENDNFNPGPEKIQTEILQNQTQKYWDTAKYVTKIVAAVMMTIVLPSIPSLGRVAATAPLIAILSSGILTP